MTDADAANILVADDLPDKLLVYQSILEELGQNLVTAHSGEDALGKVLRQEFAVILLDVNMPGMDGFETAALIRKRRRSAHTPIIFLTAFADEMRAAEGYAHGAVDFILTPVVPDILRAKVRVFVDLYRMTRQVRRQAEERVALAEERLKRAAAEESTRRAAFLADVSRALAGSLDPDTTARTLARQAVPFLADVAGVTLAGEPGQPWRTELAWAYPPDKEVFVRRLTAPDGPQDDLRAAIDRALTSGAAEYLDDLAIPIPDPHVQPPPDEYRVRSAAVVPLKARGRILGVLTLAYGPSGRRHEPADQALADDLASRAAIALDNARLYHDVERADRQKNEFLSMLAHELRNPLAPIRNAAEVIRLRAPNQPELNWARDVIDRQLTHMVRLVDDLLDVSRITRGKIRLKVEPVNLADVVTQAVEASRPAITAAGHVLDVTVPATPVWVTGDSARLVQVVTNLLNNAAKYTEAGGRVWVALARDGLEAVIRVRDNGIGIPADMLASVFELFIQVDRTVDRSQGGLGVGLTLVRRLAELHGGRVDAFSDGPGTGSEFVVRLPALATPPVAAATENGAEPTGSPRRLRILLVDDNVDAAESLAALFRLAGHELRVAHDGPSALAAVAGYRPDLVLLDIGLPGMDGYELVGHLRTRPDARGAVFVAVTGYGRDEDRERSRAAGFDHHLVKPVDPTALQQVLAPLLFTRRPKAGAAAGAG